jgi:hypothetical protein
VKILKADAKPIKNYENLFVCHINQLDSNFTETNKWLNCFLIIPNITTLVKTKKKHSDQYYYIMIHDIVKFNTLWAGLLNLAKQPVVVDKIVSNKLVVWIYKKLYFTKEVTIE